jgi:hypothetical protein
MVIIVHRGLSRSHRRGLPDTAEALEFARSNDLDWPTCLKRLCRQRHVEVGGLLSCSSLSSSLPVRRPRDAAPSTQPQGRIGSRPHRQLAQRPNHARVQHPNQHSADPARRSETAAHGLDERVLARYRVGSQSPADDDSTVDRVPRKRIPTCGRRSSGRDQGCGDGSAQADDAVAQDGWLEPTREAGPEKAAEIGGRKQ